MTINTIALSDPLFITKAAREFRSQAIIVSIDCFRHDNGQYEVFSDFGTTSSGKTPVDWAQEAEDRGAGEIFLNSINRDGTAQGYDLDLISSVAEKTSVPIVASGGAGGPEHMISAVKAGAGAVLAASIFHFGEYSISDVKEALERAGIPVRRTEAEVQGG